MILRYRKANATLHIRNVPLDMAKMKAELIQHRYYFERIVEQRTERLLKRITVLESCNATLCDKLDMAYQEIAKLRQQSADNDALTIGQTAKPPFMNNLQQKQLGATITIKRAENVASN